MVAPSLFLLSKASGDNANDRNHLAEPLRRSGRIPQARSRGQVSAPIARLCGGRVYGQAPNRFQVDLPGDIQGDFELCENSASIKLRSLSLKRDRELAAPIAKWDAEDKARKEVAS